MKLDDALGSFATHGNLQYFDIRKNAFNLSSVFSFITGYLAYW